MNSINCPGSNLKVSPEKLLKRELLNRDFDIFASPWLTRACNANQRGESFEALIYLWVTFNAWLANVISDRSKTERDSYLVQAAGLDLVLSRRFLQLFEEETFRNTAREFQELWPVFKVRALVENGISSWGSYIQEEDRDSYRIKCFNEGNLQPRDYAPSCFLEHQSGLSAYIPSAVPLDWAHTVNAIYQVRCNLFHGGKSFTYSRDRIFTELSFKILWGVWGQEYAIK